MPKLRAVCATRLTFFLYSFWLQSRLELTVYCPSRLPANLAQMQADLTIRHYELADLSGAVLDKLSDEELFACLKAGHHDALAILFRRYHLTVLKIARNILRDAGEAEDLTQAVFLELLQTAAQFDPAKGTSKRWIIRYAYHRSLNRKQYLNARAFYDQEEVEGCKALESAPTPIATMGLADHEAKRLIQEALLTLNEAQRRILTQVFFDGLAMSEIASRHRESLASVRHHYYRGLQKLRSFLCCGVAAAGDSPHGRGEQTNGQP